MVSYKLAYIKCEQISDLQGSPACSKFFNPRK